MVFLVFHYGFFLIVKSNQEHFYFWLNKKKEKKSGRTCGTPRACGRHSFLLSSACGVPRHLKMPFHCVVGSVVVLCFIWCGACHWWWSSLALVGFFFALSLSSPKNCNLTLLVSCISTSVLIRWMFNF